MTTIEVRQRETGMAVDEEWSRLGRAIGFLAASEDLAVVVVAADESDVDLLARVGRVRSDLAAAGHPEAAVVLAHHGRRPDLTSGAFSAGGIALEVPDRWLSEAPDVLAGLIGSMLPDLPPSGPPAPAPEVRADADPTAYAGTNPDLTDADVAAWWARVSSPD